MLMCVVVNMPSMIACMCASWGITIVTMAVPYQFKGGFAGLTQSVTWGTIAILKGLHCHCVS